MTKNNLYTTAKGSSSSTSTFDNTVISKRTADLKIVWEIMLGYVIQSNAFVLDSEEKYLYFAVFDNFNWYVGKMLASDGSISSFFKSDSVFINFSLLTLSNNGTYIYVGGQDSGTGSLITELFSSNLAVSFSLKITETAPISLESYYRNSVERNILWTVYSTS